VGTVPDLPAGALPAILESFPAMCPPGAFQVEHEASLTSLEVGFQEASLTFILPRKGPLIAHCLASSGSIGRKKVRSAHGSHGGIGLNSLEIGAIHALEASATVRIERHRLLLALEDLVLRTDAEARRANSRTLCSKRSWVCRFSMRQLVGPATQIAGACSTLAFPC